MGLYIADFYCAAARLIIEVDGLVHGTEDVAERDALRTLYLEKQGLVVYRITSVDVMHDPGEAASEVIRIVEARLVA